MIPVGGRREPWGQRGTGRLSPGRSPLGQLAASPASVTRVTREKAFPPCLFPEEAHLEDI